MPVDSSVDVATLLNFTEADLASNRAGRLSDTQKQTLKDNQRRGTVLGIVFAMLLAGFGIYLLVGRSEIDIRLSGIFSLLISAAVVYYTLKLNRISPDDLHVQQVTGYLQKETIGSTDDKQYNEGVSHFLVINDVRLQVSRSFYDTFSEGDPYTFYYLVRDTKNVSEAPRPIAYEPAIIDA